MGVLRPSLCRSRYTPKNQWMRAPVPLRALPVLATYLRRHLPTHLVEKPALFSAALLCWHTGGMKRIALVAFDQFTDIDPTSSS